LKRFIFSSAVWTPLLLCFPPPPIKRLRNKNEGLFQIFLSSSLPASTLPQMQKRGQTHNALPTPPSQPASQLWRHTKLTAYFLKFTSKRSTTMQQPCIGWWPAVEEWEECEECMGNPQQRRSRRRRRRRQECCGGCVRLCVCVFCVLLLQTATLNVLLQTAQFQHLQSPKTEHPKQRFFFPILHK
jgi:hypothetical protein